MPRIKISLNARDGLERCQSFLKNKNPLAEKNAARAIIESFEILAAQPHIGRPFETDPALRELIIPFGDTGYLALYRVDGDVVVILEFRHMKEAGY